ncbi:MAG: ammonia channel protein, partial [Mucilaginibacter sp.]
MKKFIPFGVLLFVVALALAFPSVKTVTIANNKIDSGDTAWMLTATALVLIMTPGLAFFYGGMVRKKNVLATMA